jgi:FixJ family two-component response regulator
MAGLREKSVFVVGQLGPVDEALDDVLARRGVRTRTFASVEDYLKSRAKQDCDLLVVDLAANPAQGLQLLAALEQTLPGVPKIALADHQDIPTTVQAIKTGAANCLEKPVDAGQLVLAIERLLGKAYHSRPVLTRAEKAVLRLILDGKTTLEIAQLLGRSPRTVEVHRSRLMRKLGVSSAVNLMRKAASMGLIEAVDQPRPESTRASAGRGAKP